MHLWFQIYLHLQWSRRTGLLEQKLQSGLKPILMETPMTWWPEGSRQGQGRSSSRLSRSRSLDIEKSLLSQKRINWGIGKKRLKGKSSGGWRRKERKCLSPQKTLKRREGKRIKESKSTERRSWQRKKDRKLKDFNCYSHPMYT